MNAARVAETLSGSHGGASIAMKIVRNFNRRFLSATGMSPRQYLRRVRIETAKRLLEGPNASIDRVAEQVGYSDTRAFIRAFGVLAGLSPGQYRHKFRARDPV